jgi:hypothetical protein
MKCPRNVRAELVRRALAGYSEDTVTELLRKAVQAETAEEREKVLKEAPPNLLETMLEASLLSLETEEAPEWAEERVVYDHELARDSHGYSCSLPEGEKILDHWEQETEFQARHASSPEKRQGRGFLVGKRRDSVLDAAFRRRDRMQWELSELQDESDQLKKELEQKQAYAAQLERDYTKAKEDMERRQGDFDGAQDRLKEAERKLRKLKKELGATRWREIFPEEDA